MLDVKVSYFGICVLISVVLVLFGGCYLVIKYLLFGFNYDFDFWGGECVVWEVVFGQVNVVWIDSQVVCIGFLVSIVCVYSDFVYVFIVCDFVEEELKCLQCMIELSQKCMSVGFDSKVQL